MIRVLVFTASLAIAAPLTLAHEGRHQPQHGGQVVVAGGHHHLELVAKDGELTLYVSNEDHKPDMSKGLAATATVLAAGKQQTVKLDPQGDNILKGKGTFVVAKGMRVVVSLTMPEHKPVTARFTPAD